MTDTIDQAAAVVPDQAIPGLEEPAPATTSPADEKPKRARSKSAPSGDTPPRRVGRPSKLDELERDLKAMVVTVLGIAQGVTFMVPGAIDQATLEPAHGSAAADVAILAGSVDTIIPALVKVAAGTPLEARLRALVTSGKYGELVMAVVPVLIAILANHDLLPKFGQAAGPDAVAA